MFWRFGGYANISSIDNILDKPDVTLEDLLDENDVIQELKAQNAKLIEFLRDEAALAKLLKYVLAPKIPQTDEKAQTPEAERNRVGFFRGARSTARSKSRSVDEDSEQKEAKRSKYAFVACEVLASEVWSISESLLESSDLLRDFWEYIKSEDPLDNQTASYFTKVNEALLEKKPAEMVALIKSIDNVVANLMKHVDCPVMMDLLLKLISLEKEPTTQGIVDWLQSQDLIPIFLSYITPEHSQSTQTAAGDFLKAIITISANATGQDASVIGPNELTRQLVSEECITKLLDEMLKGGNPLTVGVGIIIEVIRKNNSDYDTEGQAAPEPKSSDPIYLGTLLRNFATHVPKFMELILSQNHTVVTDKGSQVVERKKLNVAWGEKIEPLGFDRFKTCELMAELLHCSNMRLLNEKGSEAELKQRDSERERLKSEGKLATERPQRASGDFGTSVDSSGFHHAEAFSPLGESPEDVRTLEVQNSSSGDDDEEFEKVAVSEAMPERADQEEDEEDKVDLSAETGDSGAGEDSKQARPSSKRRISLLTEQLQEEETALSNPAGTESEMDTQNPDDKPAPLFSKRASDQPSAGAPPADTEEEGQEEQQQASADKTEGSQSNPNNTDGEQKQPDVQLEDDGTPVVGDLLKMMFVEHRVVPIILDFFFRFPWNNFLHNVVYDVVQQVFNGSMDRGYNRNLAIDLFETGCITNRVIEGQKRSDKSQEESKRRLGYMGHLTLIAEEVVKFTERQPPELLSQSVVDKTMDPEWVQYVEQTLTETRDRDNAILGGVRPDHSVGPRQAVLNAVNASQGGFGGGGSAALANAGLSGNVTGGLDSMDLASAGAAGYGLGGNTALLSGFGGSDDEEDDDMEEGELGGDSAEDYQNRRRIDDDDQSSSQPILIPPQQPSSDPPPIPAPLAVPPSRARRQLAARLAQKQGLTQSGEGSLGSDSGVGLSASQSSSDQSSSLASSSSSHVRRGSRDETTPVPGGGTTLTIPQRLVPQTGPPSDDGFPDVDSSEEGEDEGGNGFADDFTGFGGESTGTETGTEGEGEGDDDGSDEDEDDSGDDDTAAPVQRQTTREAVQRRPLDGDDDSDDEEEEDDVQLPPPLQQPQRSMSASAAAEAKKREQDRLLRRWGFDEEGDEKRGGASVTRGTAVDTDTDEDDDDEDDEPVLMGSKYTARRRTES